MKKVNWFKLLIYLSLIFLIFFLIKSDLLKIPGIHHVPHILVATIFLVCALIMLSVRWFKMLAFVRLPISFSDGLISCGLSIYAKYIPGKFLMVFSKTTHIKRKYGYKTDGLLMAAFNDQLIAIWTGLLLGSVSFLYIQSNLLLAISVLVFILFSLSIFTDFFHSILRRLIKKFFKKDLNIKVVSYRIALRLLPYHLVYWLMIGFGFYFLFKGLYNSQASLYSIFIFPLSVVLGIISIISPGGLGVREAVLTAFFTINYDADTAISISTVSRLWFLLGETIIFLTGLLFYQLSRRKNTRF